MKMSHPLIELIREIEKNKGTIHRVEYVREGKIRAKNPPPALIRKRTVFSMRLGHSYYNQKAVMEKHESGERAVEGLPPSMRHLSPAVVEHDNGTKYLVGQPIGKPDVVWEMGKRRNARPPYAETGRNCLY
jgi:hypothetical protein